MTRNSKDENCLQCFFECFLGQLLTMISILEFQVENNPGLAIQQRRDCQLARLPSAFNHANERFET